MKREGILHPGLNALLASTGHTDLVTICDRGFPVPVGPERIDLALTDDIPTVLDVLSAVHAEFTIDRVLMAEEIERASPERVQGLRELLGDVPLVTVPHLDLKGYAQSARGTVRTADTTPYANLILVSG